MLPSGQLGGYTVSDELGHGQRISAVETEVQTIRSEVGGMRTELGVVKADVKGLGAILNRIEQGILRAQDQQDHREAQSKPNLVAVVSVLITMITIIVGGAWAISGQLSRMDERSIWVQRQIDRNEHRLWREHAGGGNGVASDPK